MCIVSPDFIAISETKLKSKCSTNIQISNYTLFMLIPLTSVWGVRLYVNTKLQHTVRQDLALPIDGCKSLFIEVKWNNVSDKICVVRMIFRYPSPNLQAFQLAFTDLLETMHSEKNNYIIGGGTNAKLLKYQIDTHISEYFDSILSLGCISLIIKPTGFSSTPQPSLLDHININIIDDSTTTGITFYDISDHPSSAFDDRPGKDLLRVLKRPPISQPQELGLRRGCSDETAALSALVINLYFSVTPWDAEERRHCFPCSFKRGATGVEVSFHNIIMGNLIVKKKIYLKQIYCSNSRTHSLHNGLYTFCYYFYGQHCCWTAINILVKNFLFL